MNFNWKQVQRTANKNENRYLERMFSAPGFGHPQRVVCSLFTSKQLSLAGWTTKRLLLFMGNVIFIAYGVVLIGKGYFFLSFLVYRAFFQLLFSTTTTKEKHLNVQYSHWFGCHALHTVFKVIGMTEMKLWTSRRGKRRRKKCGQL